MLFSEIIEQILCERNIDSKTLADELGISFLQVDNLRNGVTKKPSERVCQKITDYCEKYSIDADFDWDEILYNLFESSDWDSDYIWESDLDEGGFVRLKHKKCRKSTMVPSSAFGTNSIPCIHCWIEKYISADVYTVNASEYDDNHEFIHKCGHKYTVSYNDIKQKNYRCPVCNGYKYNVDNIRKSKVHTIECIQAKIDNWPKGLKAQIERLAQNNGFYYEDSDSVFCQVHFPNIKQNEFVFICGKCFSSEFFSKDESSIPKIENFILEHQFECKGQFTSIIEDTKNQSVIWVPDVEKVLSLTSFFTFGNVLSDVFEKIKNGDYKKETYVAKVSEPDDNNTAYLFLHYANEKDESEIYDFFATIDPFNITKMTMYILPKEFLSLLYQTIEQTMDTPIVFNNIFQMSCDEYINLIDYFKNNKLDIFMASALSKCVDILAGLVGKKTNKQRDNDVKKYLSLQKCPVCGSFNNSVVSECNDCHFDGVNKVFLNKDELILWRSEVLESAKEKYKKEHPQ